MRRLNILMVADFIFNDDKGGSGRVVTELSKTLVKKEHNVYILTRKINKNLPSKEEIKGVKIFRYDVTSMNPMTFVLSSLRNSFRIFNQILKETKFDIVVFHHPLPALGVSLSKNIKNIPKIYIFHSSWPQEYKIRTNNKGMGLFLRGWFERKILNKSKRIIVLSNFSKQQILKLYQLAPSNIEIIPGGVDIEKFKPFDNRDAIRIKLDIPLDKFLLFTVRELTVRTGIENLIKAIAEITKKYKNVLFIIGGKGFLESKLKQLTRELNLEKYIRFTGLIEENVLPLYYQAADVFILPTKYLEGFGLVTLESLACGTPVLGTPVGGTVEILKNLNERFLFRDTEVNSMVRSITEFINEHKNKTGEIRQRCRQFVLENYSWEKTVSRLEESILGLL